MSFKVSFVVFLIAVAGFSGKLAGVLKKQAGVLQSSVSRQKQSAEKAKAQRRLVLESISSGDESLDKELREVMTYDAEMPVIESFKKRLRIKDKKKGEKTNSKEVLYNLYLRVLKFHLNLENYYFAAGVFIIVFSLLFYQSESLYHAVHVFSGTGFNVSRIVLLLISASAFFFFLLVRRNIWSDCGGNVFAGPLVMFLCSSAALKRYDFNFPVFNRIFGSTLFPAIVFAGVIFIA